MITSNKITQLKYSLSGFDHHDLERLSASRLMDRIDSKFLVPENALVNILDRCREDYSLLSINDEQIFQYDNVYFDTDDYTFYHMHHNGKLNRVKIRHRQYRCTNTAYLEIKFKNNKKRTIKKRVQVQENALHALRDESDFVREYGFIDPAKLKTSQFSRYFRVCLANEQAGERITFDFFPEFHDARESRSVVLSDVVIVELKQSCLNRKSEFFQLMKSMGYRPISFSKYCMGLYLAGNSRIKTNQFKQNGLQLGKINHQPLPVERVP